MLQLLLVVTVIFVPESVTMFLDKAEAVDVDKVQIEMPAPAGEAAPGGSNEVMDDKAIDELMKPSSPAPAGSGRP